MKPINLILKDLDLFISIQVDKYLQSTGKKEFSDEREIQSVMPLIIDNYNDRIAPEKLRLDNLNDTAKKKWFSSIEIDWSAKAEILKISDPGDNDPLYQEMNDLFDKTFDFLPAGSMSLMIFSGAALDAVNFPLERYESFLEGISKPSNEEKEIILWAFEVTVSLVAAESEQYSSQKKEFFQRGVAILQEYLNKKESIKIANKMTRSIKDAFNQEKSK
jgi:hypothetical protein